MKNIIVIGATGKLGQKICSEILRLYHPDYTIIATDYNILRGEKFTSQFDKRCMFYPLNVNNEDEICNILSIHNVEIVIVAVKQQVPLIQKYCIKKRIHCIDVTVFGDFVNQVEKLNDFAEKNQVCLVSMAGFFPGLSGIIASDLAKKFSKINKINVGLLQNTNADVGISGILDMLSIVNSGFHKKRKMKFLEKQREVRLIKHYESIVLASRLNVVCVNYWTAWNSLIFNKFITFCKYIGIINKIIKSSIIKKILVFKKTNFNKNENVFLSIEINGVINNKICVKTTSLQTFSDYQTTALTVVALSKIIMKSKNYGVCYPFEITNYRDLFNEMKCEKIKIFEE